MNTNLNLSAQASGQNYFWSWYNGPDSPSGSFLGWMSYDNSVRTNIVADVNLGTTNAAGTWYIFLKTLEYNFKSNALVSAGNGSVATPRFEDHDYNTRWSGPHEVTSTVAFTNVLIAFAKGDPNPTNTDKLMLEGLFITTNAYLDTPDGLDRFIYYFKPSVTNSSPNISGNWLDDSSFELWPSHGWAFEAYTSNQGYGQSALVHTNAINVAHGTRSIHVTDGGTVFSRIFKIRGDRRYTLSFYAKSTNTTSRITATLGPYHIAPTSQVSVTRLTLLTGVIATTNWVRYSATGVLWNYPSQHYQLILECNQGDHPEDPSDLFIDGVQVEEGDLTAFTTRFPAEFALHTTNTGNIFRGTPVIQVDGFNNTNAATSKTLTFEVFDVRNRRATNGSFAFTCGASNVTTTALTFGSLTNGGSYRMVGWTDAPTYREELIFSVMPVAVLSTNSTLGTHANFVPFHALLMTNLGIKYVRGLSPGSIFRWQTLEPTEGAFAWTATDSKVNALATNGIELVASMSTNFEWPSFANDGANNGLFGAKFLLPKYSNLVYAVVNRYKSQIHYWEFWNEPQYAFTTNFMAGMHTNFVQSIRNADANARIVGLGGETDSIRATNTWSLLDSSIQAELPYLAFHAYPYNVGVNSGDYDARFKDFAGTFLASGVELWNTETGVNDTGYGFTDNSGFAPAGAYYSETTASARWSEPNFSTEQALANYCRSIGMRFTKYFYYDFRIRANPSYQRTEFTALEFSDSVRPKLITLALANQLIGNGRGTGWITNNASSGVEAYLITNATGVVVPIWSIDRVNRFLTVTNTGFAQLDEMCNPVTFTNSRIYLGRKPGFLVTTTLTASQISNTVKFATATNISDTLAPLVSIDMSPNGAVTTNNFPNCFKWQGIDDTSLFVSQYAYRLSGYETNWSSWTYSNYTEYASVPVGTYYIEVKSKDVAGNESAAMSGPAFSFGMEAVVPPAITVGPGMTLGSGMILR